MEKAEEFLTHEQEQEIVEAIRLAEKETSGEIRVHIEKETSVDAFARATEVFHLLKMDQTELKNGVLIYLAVQNHNFAIIGDKGINDVVPTDFWDCTKEAMVAQFKLGNFKQGLIDGVTRAGKQLRKHFPCHETDSNELSNEISK